MAKVAVLAIPALLHLLLAGTEGAARRVEHRQCSMELYTRADASLPGASSSWRKLLDHHAAFAVCDDGALADQAVLGFDGHGIVQPRILEVEPLANAEFRREVSEVLHCELRGPIFPQHAQVKVPIVR